MLINEGNGGDFRIDENFIIRFKGGVCVPDVSELKKRILEEGHRSGLSIHPIAIKIYQYLKKIFWWPGMTKEVAKFVYACLTSQKSKIKHHKPSGLMQLLSIPEWKLDSIMLGFMTSSPKTSKGNDSVWVVVDMLTKLAHFITIKITYSLKKLVEVYIEKIVSFHGIPSSIVSDRYLRCTSRFWESL